MDMFLLLFIMDLALGSSIDPVHNAQFSKYVPNNKPVPNKEYVPNIESVTDNGQVPSSEAVPRNGLVPTASSDGPYISALKYLTKYGYLDQGQDRNLSLFDSFENSLKRFQEFFSMTQSGELDSETVRAMEKPRCGVVDTILDQGEVRQVDLPGEGGAKRRQKRYSFYDSFFYQDIMDLFRTRIRPFDTPSR